MHHDQHHTPRPDRQEKVYIRAHASGGVISVNQRKRHIRILGREFAEKTREQLRRSSCHKVDIREQAR